jgi:O-antigen/teichoic acid export membrane protein
MIIRLFNAGLRLSSLVMKLGLTLYMGKFLGLAELGTYGLVASYVAIAIPLLGFRFDYVVSRDIVDEKPLALAIKMRDQMAFYALSYLGLIAVVLGVMFLSDGALNPKILVFTLILCVLESVATVTATNFISLKKQITSSILFFIRAALWVLPVVILGLLNPEYRTAETVLEWWLGGVVLSLVITAYLWRNLPWGEVVKTPINRAWIKKGVKNCFFIWIGAVGAAAAGNIDRFVVEYYLGRESVGIASFYGSFIVAIAALLGSGIFAFGYPQLISYHKEQKLEEFNSLVRKMTIHACLVGAIMCVVIGAIVPFLGNLFDRREFAENAPTLWLMLLGIWMKSATESLFYVMYARHQDKPTWLGNILLLVVAFMSSYVLMPYVGFIAIGYSAVISAAFLCLWRIFWIKKLPAV